MNRITYISESTRQLMQGSAEVQELASVAYRTAVSLEEKLHRFSLLTSSIEQNGICVSVEESEKLDCYNTSIRLKHHSDSLTLGIASDGAIFMLLASTWDYSGDTPKLHLFHLDEMLTSSLSNELKAVARVVIYIGLMDEYLADFLDSVDDILTKEKLSAEIETIGGSHTGNSCRYRKHRRRTFCFSRLFRAGDSICRCNKLPAEQRLQAMPDSRTSGKRVSMLSR